MWFYCAHGNPPFDCMVLRCENHYTRRPEAQADRRTRELVKATQETIASAIEEDLNGERIMKSVWEDCNTDAEVELVKAEMRRIIDLIRRPQELKK